MKRAGSALSSSGRRASAEPGSPITIRPANSSRGPIASTQITSEQMDEEPAAWRVPSLAREENHDRKQRQPEVGAGLGHFGAELMRDRREERHAAKLIDRGRDDQAGEVDREMPGRKNLPRRSREGEHVVEVRRDDNRCDGVSGGDQRRGREQAAALRRRHRGRRQQKRDRAKQRRAGDDLGEQQKLRGDKNRERRTKPRAPKLPSIRRSVIYAASGIGHTRVKSMLPSIRLSTYGEKAKSNPPNIAGHHRCTT